MSTEKLFVPILLGTNREGRQSEHVAKWLVKRVEERSEIRTQLFDTRDFEMPTTNYGTDIKDKFPEWRDAMASADGLIIIAPEYNHAYPGILKSVLDLLLKEYIHKAVALVGVSAGPWGGTRVIESLIPVVRELGLTVTFSDLQFPSVQNMFDEKGNIKDEERNAKHAKSFIDELVWMANALKNARALDKKE